MNRDVALKVAEVKQMLQDNKPADDILALLRQEGYSKMESVKVLYLATGKSLREVQLLVHSSAVWTDIRERDAKVHNEIVDYLEQSNQNARHGGNEDQPANYKQD